MMDIRIARCIATAAIMEAGTRAGGGGPDTPKQHNIVRG